MKVINQYIVTEKLDYLYTSRCFIYECEDDNYFILRPDKPLRTLGKEEAKRLLWKEQEDIREGDLVVTRWGIDNIPKHSIGEVTSVRYESFDGAKNYDVEFDVNSGPKTLKTLSKNEFKKI